MKPFVYALIFLLVAGWFLATLPNAAMAEEEEECRWSWCAEEKKPACAWSWCAEKGKTKRTYITDRHRRVVGDIYDPGVGRVQIRDKHRQIIGYIETDGRIVNTRGQEVAELELGKDD